MKNKIILQSLLWAAFMLMSAYFSESPHSAQINLLILTAGWFMMFSTQTGKCSLKRCLANFGSK